MGDVKSDVKSPNDNGNAGEGQEAPQMPPEAPPPTPEEVVTPEVLEKIIKGYNEDCDLVDFSAKMGTAVGDNYMSIMYAVNIQMKNRKNGETETIDVMLKTMPRNPMRQQMIADSGAFIKDANMYMSVFPAMVAFQKEKGLKEEEIYTPWPKCYTTFHDGKSDYLGMEDLRTHGFKMANRLTGLDIEHANLVLRNIARFHAISFAMFEGDYDQIMDKYPWLEEKMFPTVDKVQEPMKMWMQSAFLNEGDVVKREGFEKEGELVKKIVDDSFWTEMNRILGCKVKNAVINHGDCWTNNMLFHYDGTTPKSIKFVDFQLSRCSSRCIDLGYFLHSSIPIPNLNRMEEDFMKVYYEEFTRFVTKLGVDTAVLELTWDNLWEEYRSYKFYGVVMGLMLAPILSADAADVPDMESIKEEDFSGDGAKDFLNQLMGTKSDSTKKICNLAINHLPKCPQMANK